MASLAAVPETAASAQNLSLELTRVIAAPIQRVFDAWTRPEMIRQWFCPTAMSVPAVETDPVPGGEYTIHIQGTRPAPDAKSPSDTVIHNMAVRGTYTKVSPFDLLQFTWNADWAAGETSLVTLHFREIDGGTELRLIHERFTTESSREGHNRGWNSGLDKLTALLS